MLINDNAFKNNMLYGAILAMDHALDAIMLVLINKNFMEAYMAMDWLETNI